MYVDVPEYLVPKLKQAAKHLNIPLFELVCDALMSYMQELEDAEDIRSSKPRGVDISRARASYHKRKMNKSLKTGTLVKEVGKTDENDSL